MIPLRDENPTRTVPYVVYALVVLNVLVFLYNRELDPQGGNPLHGYELVPAALTGSSGNVYAPIPPWLTIFTAMFLHANWLHLIGNMLYLWIFGNNVEDVLGHFRFLVFYIFAGVGAAAAQVLLDYNSRIPMVGASGAIAGVLGAYFLLFPRARVITLVFVQLVALPASVVLGLWIVLQVLNSLLMTASGVGGGVAYAAHVGGFFTGLIMVSMMGGRRLLRGRRSVEYHDGDGFYQ